MSEMVDRVAVVLVGLWMETPSLLAKEVIERWNTWTPATREPWLRSAHLIIWAMREPTDDMIHAGFGWGMGQVDQDIKDGWYAMIDEALR